MFWNEVAILRAIQESRDRSVTQRCIADITALSLPTVQRNVQTLMIKGVIRLDRPSKGTSYRYSINPQRAKEEYGV